MFKIGRSKNIHHKEKVELLKKYCKQIGVMPRFYAGEEIPPAKLDNAIAKYAQGVEKESVLGLYDTTILNSGKEGYVFTDDRVCFLEPLRKPQIIAYKDIASVGVKQSGRKDCDHILVFHLCDGTTVEWNSILLNKTPLMAFFKELLAQKPNNPVKSKAAFSFKQSREPGAAAGGISAAAYGQVNKSFDEERFHARQGHGYSAERANNLYDRLTGHKAKIVGDDNIKNGADRIVDGVMIQSKYCKTGSQCISECFDSRGRFRYMAHGKPMQIEVPSDQYDAAVQALELRIRQGAVQGVTDSKDAGKIIRKGHFTYEQAKNIARSGTVESLTYDAVNGTVIAGSALGVTGAITLAINLWNGESFEDSLKCATYSGIRVGGTAFVTTVLAGQLSKAGVNSALVGSSEAVVAMMGPKASAALINAFRSGSNIYGAAAMKSAAKLLRGNAISAGVTVVVLSSVDIANIFKGRISGKQLFKNVANNASTVAGGTGGWMAGASVGTTIMPGFGTVVGGLIGSVAVGSGAGKLSNAVLGVFIEDDADEMVRIIQTVFQSLAADYLLAQKEAEATVDRLSNKLNVSMLKDMFACNDREGYARNLLIPIIENETGNRKHIPAVSNRIIARSLREVLEIIADSENTAKGSLQFP